MDALINDIRYGFRMLLKNWSFTLIAVVALALGIGGTTALFSVVDEVLLHPLPYSDPDRIVSVERSERSTGVGGGVFSPANYIDFAASTQNAFAHIASSRGWSGSLTGSARPERVSGTMVTASFFPIFGVNPLIGRYLLPQDEKSGSAHVVVLGYGLWHRRFGGDRSILERKVFLDGEPYTVVGVMPQSFDNDLFGDLWLPSPWGVPTHPLVPFEDPRGMRDRHYLDVWARLRSDVPIERASAQANAVGEILEKKYPDSNPDFGVRLQRLKDYEVGDIRSPLIILFAAVAAVLLIGCANVANLLLARATTRSKELSIRTALGAARIRLIRQLLTESVLLAIIGGGIGVLLAAWAIPSLLAFSPKDISSYTHIGMNREVLAFSFGISVLSGIIFGLFPAFHASSTNLNETLREGERGSTAGHGRTRAALVVVEISLSLILLVGAGLMIRSFAELMNVDPGFNTENLLTFNISLPRTVSAEEQTAFYERILQRLRALPGVTSAGAVSRLPLLGGNSTRSFSIPGSKREDLEADLRVSTPGYFRSMQIPVLKGRVFDERDKQSRTFVAVANEAMVRNVFPGQDPIGKVITNLNPDDDRTIEIIGVIGNIRHSGLETAPRAEIYQPLGQAQWFSMNVVVRTQVNPLSLINSAQNAVWSVDKDVPLDRIRTMREVVANSVSRRKFTMLLLAIFAGFALLLAAIGLYGVMSYSVSQRTQEIGIRMALGAERRDVLKLIVRHGMSLTIVGIAIGLFGALIASRLLSGLLFGVSSRDPGTFAGITLFLSAVAFCANYIPARRASKLDPLRALHYE